MAKNTQIRRCGYSPEMYVFGRQLGWAFSGCVDEEGAHKISSLDSDGEIARAAKVRATAIRAFHEMDVQNKYRRALLRTSRGTKGPYLPGTLVYFWRPDEKLQKGRVRPDPTDGPGQL